MNILILNLNPNFYLLLNFYGPSTQIVRPLSISNKVPDLKKKEGFGVTLKSHGPQPPTHPLIYNNLPIQQEIDRVQIANSVTAETYDK